MPHFLLTKLFLHHANFIYLEVVILYLLIVIGNGHDDQNLQIVPIPLGNIPSSKKANPEFKSAKLHLKN